MRAVDAPASAATSAAARPANPAPMTMTSEFTECRSPLASGRNRRRSGQQRILVIEVRERTLPAAGIEVIRVHDPQVDQFVQPRLLELLPPQDTAEPLPSLLQKVLQGEVRLMSGGLPALLQESGRPVGAETALAWP